MRSKLDLEQLRIELRTMTRSHQLYAILKNELTTLGYWRMKPRGNPAKGFKAMRKRQPHV